MESRPTRSPRARVRTLDALATAGATTLAQPEHVVGRLPRPLEPLSSLRPRVAGKFLYVGDEKLYIRGVTYGTFRPRDGVEFPAPSTVQRDFALMASHAINAIRTYTTPPRWLLDAADRHGLRVLVGLPAERYIGYLADRRNGKPDIASLVRGWVAECAGHPAVLAYSIGNEIPASIARWHGSDRVEQYLERLYRAVKETDPEGLVTYANYPSTEYLSLPFLDLLCFNVFLESRSRLDAYLARLQCLADDRPLLMGEVGLDAHRNGHERQSETLDWQIRTCFEAGCAGVFVYSWTDEWYRGGAEVADWSFGLTRRDREPKPALTAARRAFAAAPFNGDVEWPRVSVAVCTYNGSRTLDETLAALERLDYPDYEVIVVNDGSTDASAEIASRRCCRLVSTENRGLSHARNLALELATGSIIAYLDDDAYPDPHWLRYLALAFLQSEHGAIGGPNLAPPGDGWIAECVANAPGNPVHVLISDREAEHIPGCNMAFRTSAIRSVGGFDPQFRVAGDDVDLCWRLTDAGFTIGFSAAAMVWHHRRNSVRAFWRQQRGYGRAEGMLERRWPARHDDDGQIAWGGRIYGKGLVRALSWRRGRVYQGVWGTAPFQSVYEPAVSGWAALLQSPVWYLLVASLGALALLGLDWPPLKLAAVPFGLAVVASLIQAARSAAHASFQTAPLGPWRRLGLRIVTASLYLAQPAARLWGRLSYTLPNRPARREWRVRDLRPLHTATWTEERAEATARVAAIESALRDQSALVRRGGEFDHWDLEARRGSFGAARLLVAVEEHDLGHQLIRVRVRPRIALRGPLLVLMLGGLAFGAAMAAAPIAAGSLGLAAVLAGRRMIVDVGAAQTAARRALDGLGLRPS